MRKIRNIETWFTATQKVAVNFRFFCYKPGLKIAHQLIYIYMRCANINLQLLCFINLFSFLVSCLVLSLKFLFLIFGVFIPDFKLCFLFNIIVFGFKKTKLKNTNFWSKGGLQQNGDFYEPVFAKCEKLSFFGAIFWQILVDAQNTL